MNTTLGKLTLVSLAAVIGIGIGFLIGNLFSSDDQQSLCNAEAMQSYIFEVPASKVVAIDAFIAYVDGVPTGETGVFITQGGEGSMSFEIAQLEDGCVRLVPLEATIDYSPTPTPTGSTI